MRGEVEEQGAEGQRAQKTVRFASLVAAAGKPEVYLPLFDPGQDRDIMKAVKANRVLSVRQEPTSKHADYGVVGFDERKHTTYLIFPKALSRFAEARVVGIQYDVVGSSRMSTGIAPKLPKQKPRAKRLEAAPKRVKAAAPKPSAPERIEPQPKTFRVHLRVTIVREKDVQVKAMTKAEAKKKAQSAVEGEGNVHAVSVSEVR